MSNPAAQAAAAKAAQDSFTRFTIESWTLYAFGVLMTVLRTYSRAKAVGFRNFRADDYLVWLAILFYTTQSTLAYSIGNSAHGLANNGMTVAQRAALLPGSEEYQWRIVGSKIQVAGWTTYTALIWSLKLAMCVFYIRLTEGLGQRYRVRIYIGFALLIATFLASIFTIFLSCRPFHNYWQINPDPGNACQAAVSKPIIWVSFAANVSTDAYLILIPIPMLWESSLKLIKKIASTIVLGAGVFVLICAFLKSIFVLVDPVDGAQLAGSWGTREAFVAVFTTNLPMIFPLFKSWLKPLFGSVMRSSQKTYKTPDGFRTIGGGGPGDSRSQSRRNGSGTDPNTINMTYTESEERMVNDVKLQVLQPSHTGHITDDQRSQGIVVSSEFKVTTEDQISQHSQQQLSRPREGW